MINKEHLTLDGLKKVLSLKASLNLGPPPPFLVWGAKQVYLKNYKLNFQI